MGKSVRTEMKASQPTELLLYSEQTDNEPRQISTQMCA